MANPRRRRLRKLLRLQKNTTATTVAEPVVEATPVAPVAEENVAPKPTLKKKTTKKATKAKKMKKTVKTND